MNAREKILAQNWAEQFRHNAWVTLNGCWHTGSNWSIFPSGRSPFVCLDNAFPWNETSQGHPVWDHRCDKINEAILTR